MANDLDFIKNSAKAIPEDQPSEFEEKTEEEVLSDSAFLAEFDDLSDFDTKAAPSIREEGTADDSYKENLPPEEEDDLEEPQDALEETEEDKEVTPTKEEETASAPLLEPSKEEKEEAYSKELEVLTETAEKNLKKDLEKEKADLLEKFKGTEVSEVVKEVERLEKPYKPSSKEEEELLSSIPLGLNDLISLKNMIKLLSIILVFSVLLNIILGGTISVLTPLVRVENSIGVITTTDKGTIAQVIRTKDLPTTEKINIAQYFIKEYVKEAFDIGDLKSTEQANLFKDQLRNAKERFRPTAFKKLSTELVSFNEESPDTERQLHIKNIRTLPYAQRKTMFILEADVYYRRLSTFQESKQPVEIEIFYEFEFDKPQTKSLRVSTDDLRKFINPANVFITDFRIKSVKDENNE